jgi:hypothetical protein
LLQRKAWNENQLLLKPTKQNQKKKKKNMIYRTLRKKNRTTYKNKSKLCSQNGSSGSNILCCFAIWKKRSFGNAKLLPIPSYLQGGK